MADLCPMVALLASAYGSALVGVVSALLMRTCLLARRDVRALSAGEAMWCALLPPLAVLLFPVASGLTPDATGPLHHLWHAWAGAVLRSRIGHGALHGANVLFLLLAGACLTRAVYLFARQRALAGALRTLRPRRVPCDEEAFPVYCLPSAQPLCFTVGLLRPRVYVSSALLAQLSDGDRAAMLAHEAAHIRRRDGLVGLLLTVFYALLPLPAGRLLYADWRRAAERACDTEAAQRVGSPCEVTQALVRVARLLRGGDDGTPVPGAAHFSASDSGEDIEGRVHALLALEAKNGAVDDVRRRPLLLAVLSAAHLLLLVGTEGFIRHLVELFAYH